MRKTKTVTRLNGMAIFLTKRCAVFNCATAILWNGIRNLFCLLPYVTGPGKICLNVAYSRRQNKVPNSVPYNGRCTIKNGGGNGMPFSKKRPFRSTTLPF